MPVLQKLTSILIAAGFIAVYMNYGRDLLQMFLPTVGWDPSSGANAILADWFGLAITFLLAYFFIFLVTRRMNRETN